MVSCLKPSGELKGNHGEAGMVTTGNMGYLPPGVLVITRHGTKQNPSFLEETPPCVWLPCGNRRGASGTLPLYPQTFPRFCLMLDALCFFKGV